MDLSALKAIFAIGTLCVCLLFGCLPVGLLQARKVSWQSVTTFKVIRGLLSTSLGVFLGICFVGLFPSVQETQGELARYFKISLHYPVAEVSILAGYFLFWLVAELSKLYLDRRNGSAEEGQALQEANNGPNYHSLTSCHDVAIGSGVENVSLFDLILIVASLSIKSIFESVAIGSLEDGMNVVQMGSAKLVHESICTLVMALNLANVFRDRPLYYSHLAIVTFALLNASGFGIGVALGSAISPGAIITKFVLKALAGGAMMCVVMTLFVHINQVLEPHDVRTGVKFTSVLFGFMVFALVRAIHTVARGTVGHDGLPHPTAQP